MYPWSPLVRLVEWSIHPLNHLKSNWEAFQYISEDFSKEEFARTLSTSSVAGGDNQTWSSASFDPVACLKLWFRRYGTKVQKPSWPPAGSPLEAGVPPSAVTHSTSFNSSTHWRKKGLSLLPEFLPWVLLKLWWDLQGWGSDPLCMYVVFRK